MRGLTGIVLLWLGLFWFALPVAAETPNRAGLIILHGDGRVATRCVEFSEESISGAELLTRSGLALNLEATGMGASVCSIEGEGCGPGSNCFCQCQSSPCLYWSYWQMDAGEWRYANLGAGLTQVRDGMVEGWVWGEGNMRDEAESKPPLMTLDDLCSVATSDPVAPEDDQAMTTGDSPLTMLVVAGVPLLLAAAWWWRRQARRGGA